MGNYKSDQKNARHYTLKLSKNTDRDIIEILDSQSNVQGYIKQALRNEIKRQENSIKAEAEASRE